MVAASGIPPIEGQVGPGLMDLRVVVEEVVRPDGALRPDRKDPRRAVLNGIPYDLYPMALDQRQPGPGLLESLPPHHDGVAFHEVQGGERSR